MHLKSWSFDNSSEGNMWMLANKMVGSYIQQNNILLYVQFFYNGIKIHKTPEREVLK